MATVKIIENILDIEERAVFAEKGKTVEEIVRKSINGDSYKGQMIECYNTDTGETYYAEIDSGEELNVIIQKGGMDVAIDYVIQEDDVLSVVVVPASGGSSSGFDFMGAFLGAVTGGFVGNLIGGLIGGIPGAIIGTAIGIIGGFVAGGLIVGAVKDQLKAQQDKSSSSGIDSESLPDVRGAQNEPLTDKPYPFVLGKHLCAPAIVGTTWNEISGTHGENNYIHALYCVGYAPLRISDFKLGEMLLAHNQKWSGNPGMKNIFHGMLQGTDTGAYEEGGDIVNTWSSNDVHIEILQQGQNGEEIDYGTIYPIAKIQKDINANCLYILDEALQENDLVPYKGLGLKNGLRNNPVRFSERYPKTIKVELDFKNGLYKTRSETSGSSSSVKYYKIPLWVAIQWRVYSEENDVSDGSEAGIIPIPEYDYENHCYEKIGGKVKRGWNTFASVNGIAVANYGTSERYADISAHSGNHIPHHAVYRTEYEERKRKYGYYESESEWVPHSVYVGEEYDVGDINNGWLNTPVFNLESFGGTNSETDGINEFRCITSVDLEQWARDNLKADDDTEEEFLKKFKSYFLDGSNTTKSIEVRVVRVSPCYIDETVSGESATAFKFNDIFIWNTLTSTMFDGDILENESRIVEKRPLTEERMRRCCIVALKAKTDNTDQLGNTIQKFTCMAESFAPYFDDSKKKWFPENVRTVTKYYKPSYKDNNGKIHAGDEITKEQFEEDRQNGIKSIRLPGGNDFVKNLVNNVIRVEDHIDQFGRYYIPELDDEPLDENNAPKNNTKRYITNNVASMFLLAGIGAHLGVDALGYSQSDFAENGLGDFNLKSLSKWYKWAEDVTDGSTYTSDGFHYNHNGELVRHNEGDLVHIYFAANAYIYNTEMLETMLMKICIAGRAVYTRDDKNRLVVVVDKPEEFPDGVITQQNTLKSSYSISFTDNPSGLQITYPDENDGYNQNTLYCMNEGESAENPRGAIEPYKFDYVTNNYQQWSLGRYLLANRILNKEVVVKQIGMEGAALKLGSLVVLQDDTMLIGTDTGARVAKILENENQILGFIATNTYHFTGEMENILDSSGNPVLDSYNEPLKQSVQGVIIMQAHQTNMNVVITMRLAKPGTVIEIGDESYTFIPGNTNLVLFDTPMDKTGVNAYRYKPAEQDIIGFGKLEKMSATYRIVKRKPDEKHNYEFTLMKYDEKLYNYGAELPSFQNNMTIPDRSGEDSFPLSENATQTDTVKALADSANLANDSVNSVFRDKPAVPKNLAVTVDKDGLHFSCRVEPYEMNNIDYLIYEITKADGTTEEIRGLYTAEYKFDRRFDGYPEAEGENGLCNWKFRALSISRGRDSEGYDIDSGFCDYVGIIEPSLEVYGTWQIPEVTVKTEVVDRTAILSVVYSNMNNGRQVYGVPTVLVKVKRTGNTSPVSSESEHPTFNELLGITPDDKFYMPEFSRSVQPNASADNELNYKHYDSAHGRYSTDAFETLNTKITQTLPLEGQTLRLFRENNVFTGVFTKDAVDYVFVPENPNEGDVIHYSGSTTEHFTENGYYYFNGSNWEQCESKMVIVPTEYVYQIQMRNESGYESNVVEVAVEALCTNIADIVHSHDHYKELYVEKLSAISANLGLISEGGMGDFKNLLNFWALSDLSPEDSGYSRVIKKGTFRVGGTDQYFKVTPDEEHEGEYIIELRAGNISLTSNSGTTFNQGTFIYEGSKETATKRLALTSTGLIAQKLKDRENDIWEDISKFIIDANGNLIISNAEKPFNFGFRVENGSIYHFDDNPEKDEGENNTQEISCAGRIIETDKLNPILIDSPYCFEGTVTKDISNYAGKVVFFTKADGIKIDRIIRTDGTQESTADTYNQMMKEQFKETTVGEYIGLSAEQIENGIFDEIQE